MSTLSLDLCEECNSPDYKKWFEETSTTEKYSEEEYKYERNIQNLINSLPLVSRQKVWEDDLDGGLPPQMWIDYQLNELPHKLCKEYGLYSPEERLAYSERFPHCDKVKITVWPDGSKSSRCDHGAFGNENGDCENFNMYDECFRCTSFSPRKGTVPIEINQRDELISHERERLIEMIEYANERLDALSNNPESYF